MTETFLTRKGSGLSAAVAAVVDAGDLARARLSVHRSQTHRKGLGGKVLTKLCVCGRWKDRHSMECQICHTAHRAEMQAGGAKMAFRTSETLFIPRDGPGPAAGRQGMVGQRPTQPARPRMRLGPDGKWTPA